MSAWRGLRGLGLRSSDGIIDVRWLASRVRPELCKNRPGGSRKAMLRVLASLCLASAAGHGERSRLQFLRKFAGAESLLVYLRLS